MAQKVIWSNEAIDDLDAIVEYIARDSAFYAASFAQEILEVSRSLNQFSKRGRIVPEINDDSIRELIVRQYRLIYHVGLSRVVILGLIHGRRDLNKVWKKQVTLIQINVN